MDDRAAKLALARKKLKDHQDKKISSAQNNELRSKPTGDINYTQIEIQDTVETPDHKQCSATENVKPEIDVNVTEFLISNKRNLESQVRDLKMKLYALETDHALLINDYKQCTRKVTSLENEIESISNRYEITSNEILRKDIEINELNTSKLTLKDENNNLIEQLEFTKTVLCAKEIENDSLQKELKNMQNRFDVLQLQLQQLTNGSPISSAIENTSKTENNEMLIHKISSLEQKISVMQKERDQINSHYEHYVTELNEQLKSVIKKNDALNLEVQTLSNRENSLIEQISDMEIRIQHYNVLKKESELQPIPNVSPTGMLEDFKKIQGDLDELRIKHDELQKQYAESVARVKELTETKQPECNHENISLSKLNADMVSDKIAAQRATEQNKKLKQDIQGLENAFVKMTKDKLELTEKIAAEKYLNRELTLKLAEIDQKANDIESKLKAKDEEMIRLQTNFRTIEKECEQLKLLQRNDINDFEESTKTVKGSHNDNIESDDLTCINHHTPLITTLVDKSDIRIPKVDAMVKLQERFLKIMEEVANLSDEKHRLEHIILQLQNETDTICEYVALYQQQRSLLKRRDEERSSQLKLFQQECGKLKCQLEELSLILIRFAEDKELGSYFQDDARRNDIKKVMNLLSNLKNNSLIDPVKKSTDFKNFYPCNCCSGQLLDV